MTSDPDDVEELLEGLLGKGGHVGEGLGGIIHKAMKHGVHEAKIEIHGLGDGKLGGDLEAIIRRAKEQAHRESRSHDEGRHGHDEDSNAETIRRLERELRRKREQLEKRKRDRGRIL
jgi:hypothetical protein